MTSHSLRSATVLASLAAAVALQAPPAVAGTPIATVVDSEPARAATFNGTVRAVALFGDTVYVGGDFTEARDRSGAVVRQHLAAVDVQTGQLRAWNPGADGAVHALAVTPGRVYVAGEFSHISGSARRHLAAVSRARGAQAITGWRNGADRFVKALAVGPQGLYVGGGFTTLGGVPRNRLALIHTDGTVDATWRPKANDTVRALAVGNGRVYVGGVFSSISSGVGSGYLAAIRPEKGGLVRRFDPPIRIDVNGIDVSGREAYVAADGRGGHLQVFGAKGSRLFQRSTDGALNDVVVLRRTVYFGGHFDHVCATRFVQANGACAGGQQPRGKLAAVSLRGRLRTWNPDAGSRLGALTMLAADGQIFAGGGWQTLAGGSILRPHFARFTS